MSDNRTSASGGIGFTGLLAVAFIVLKLTHVIDWSWWWVLSPLWIGLALVVAIVVIVGLIVFLKALYDHNRDRRRWRQRARQPARWS
jgi:uncharacterized membrane protein